MNHALDLIIAMCLSLLIGVYIGVDIMNNNIEDLFGMSYGKIITEVKVCKALTDDDTSCRVSMNVVEKYPRIVK